MFQVVMGVYPGLKPPMISGIDLVGTVESTNSNSFKVIQHLVHFPGYKKVFQEIIFFGRKEMKWLSMDLVLVQIILVGFQKKLQSEMNG